MHISDSDIQQESNQLIEYQWTESIKGLLTELDFSLFS